MTNTKTTSDLRTWVGRNAVDRQGDKIGTVSEVYTDDTTGRPEWLAIKTGMFGTHISFVPLEGADLRGDDVVVAYDKDTVKDAPHVEPDDHLTPEEEQRLYRHYQGSYVSSTWDRPNAEAGRGGGQRRDDDTTRGTDSAMTRSEEELRVDKETRKAGTARLKKWVETDQVDITVPVTREKAKVVREPVTDANRDAAMRGPDISEGEHEITLTEEEVNVTKQAVPKERVRLETEKETEQVPVSETVRKEHVEVEDGTRTSQRR